MDHLLAFFLTGAALGLAAALTPGPLQLLILAQTMAHGPREGSKVALAPLLTDFPVMLACLLALTRVDDLRWLMAGISLVGGLIVVRFGWGCLTCGPLDAAVPADPADSPGATAPTGVSRPDCPSRSLSAGSVRKGVAVNALNPKMILFWATVGAPTLLAALAHGWLPAVGYLAAFYLCLVGVSMALAWLSGRFTVFLSGHGYVWVMRGLGVALWAVAVGLIWDGVKRF